MLEKADIPTEKRLLPSLILLFQELYKGGGDYPGNLYHISREAVHTVSILRLSPGTSPSIQES